MFLVLQLTEYILILNIRNQTWGIAQCHKTQIRNITDIESRIFIFMYQVKRLQYACYKLQLSYTFGDGAGRVDNVSSTNLKVWMSLSVIKIILIYYL